MRKFNSYGPVNSKKHFCINREQLVQKCINSLIDDPEDGGHYFTIWAPRQTGKTWLVKEVTKQIQNIYSSKFEVGMFSMERVIIDDNDSDDVLLNNFARLIELTFKKECPVPENWKQWIDWFSKDKGIFDKPVIIMIDEFDKLHPKHIDRLVTLFREIYINFDNYWLHGLALIGVRAVLGVESERGSPFNIQRSMHIDNFVKEEVISLFQQYQEESKQIVDNEVVDKIFEVTNGQPGLVCWFGELLTEKFNPGIDKSISMDTWEHVYFLATNTIHNNTVQNIIAKARKEFLPYVRKLFSQSTITFSLDIEWCNYMYMHGLITYEVSIEDKKRNVYCRFSSPFIQYRLYNALTNDLKQISDDDYILALDPLDTLSDVFENTSLDLPALLKRYIDYLERLKSKGFSPWKDQPRRKTDYHLTEAVGHFHLYHWLQMAIGTRSAICPEFPTGNGKVDLHIICDNKTGIIEIKSFTNAYDAEKARIKAASYAKSLGDDKITIAMFAPFDDQKVLDRISVKEDIDGVGVFVVGIGQV